MKITDDVEIRREMNHSHPNFTIREKSRNRTDKCVIIII